MLTEEQIQKLASEHTGSCEYPTRYVLNSNSFAKAVEAPLLARIAKLEAKNVELERLCDATYVAEGADAYYHACEEMGKFQKERADVGKPVGTTGSLCDGIAWLYAHVNELEAKLARVEQAAQPAAWMLKMKGG